MKAYNLQLNSKDPTISAAKYNALGMAELKKINTFVEKDEIINFFFEYYMLSIYSVQEVCGWVPR